jgi:hypothetical protein
MDKIIEKYNRYYTDKLSAWKNKLTWKGCDGKNPKHTTSICKWNAETNGFASIKKVNNVNDLFKEIDMISKSYTDWVKTKNEYTKEECEDMKRFFIGAMGEFFFAFFFEELKGINLKDSTGVIKYYNMYYISPTLKHDRDLGVDFTGIINDIPSVLQIKFWNPFGQKTIGVDIIQKAYAEGISGDLIQKEENENIFICFLGNEDTLYNKIKTTNYKKNVIVIGKTAMDIAINNRNKIFWDNFYNNLENLK